jgi:chromosome segregation ATPase
MYYEELLGRLRAYAPRGSYDGERAEAAAAIECLMRENAEIQDDLNERLDEIIRVSKQLAAAQEVAERLREEVLHLKRMEQHGITGRRALLDECDSLRQDLAAARALLREARDRVRHPDYDWDADFLRDIAATLKDAP